MLTDFHISKLLARVNILGLGSHTTIAPTIRRSGSKFFRFDQAHELSTVQLPRLPARQEASSFYIHPKPVAQRSLSKLDCSMPKRISSLGPQQLADILPDAQHDDAWQSRQQYWLDRDWLELKLLAREHTDFWNLVRVAETSSALTE